MQTQTSTYSRHNFFHSSEKRSGNGFFSTLLTDDVKQQKQPLQRHFLHAKGVNVKAQTATREKKKTQTFVLRVWEREEGTRYELRTLSGERKTFKTLEELQRYVQTPQLPDEEVK